MTDKIRTVPGRPDLYDEMNPSTDFNSLLAQKMLVPVCLLRLLRDKDSGVTWRCPKCGGAKFWSQGYREIPGLCVVECDQCDNHPVTELPFRPFSTAHP